MLVLYAIVNVHFFETKVYKESWNFYEFHEILNEFLNSISIEKYLFCAEKHEELLKYYLKKINCLSYIVESKKAIVRPIG